MYVIYLTWNESRDIKTATTATNMDGNSTNIVLVHIVFRQMNFLQ